MAKKNGQTGQVDRRVTEVCKRASLNMSNLKEDGLKINLLLQWIAKLVSVMEKP